MRQKILPSSIFRQLCLEICKQTNDRLYLMKMLYYDRIDISEGIDIAKSNNRKEFMICLYWFLIMDSNFKIMYAIVVMISQC